MSKSANAIIWGGSGRRVDCILRRDKIEEFYLRKGFKSFSNLRDTIDNYRDSSYSLFKIYLNILITYKYIYDNFGTQIPMNELIFHNIIKEKKINEGLIMNNINLMWYILRNFKCDLDIKNKKVQDLILYSLKLAYNTIALLSVIQECIYNARRETVNEHKRKDIKDFFEVRNIPEVEEKDWHKVDEDTRNRLQNISKIYASYNEKYHLEQKNNKNNLIIISEILDGLLKDLRENKLLHLKVLATLEAIDRETPFDFGDETIPRDIIEFTINPLQDEVSTPRKISL